MVSPRAGTAWCLTRRCRSDMGLKSKDPRRMQQRRFRCPACGARMDMPKWRRHTAAGHVKTAWCYVCRARRDLIQTEETAPDQSPAGEDGRKDYERGENDEA